MIRTLLLLVLSIGPATAYAGGAEVEALAFATMEKPETAAGGSLLGPASSRATWFSLGGILPFDGAAMAIFSTGIVDTTPVPGTDLSAVGVDDDFAGVNFSLNVPEGMRSLRFAFRVIAPAESLVDESSVLDRLRVEVSGDPIALDPWLLGDVSPDSVGLRTDQNGLLQGTRYEGAMLTDWLVAVVPVQPLTQIPILFEVRDGGADAFGDLVMLLDGIQFDTSVPLDIPPGVVPSVERFWPDRLPEGAPSTLVVEGRELPRDLSASLVNDDGVPVLELGSTNLDWRSRERVLITIPSLESGTFGLRLGWGDGASLTWPGAVRINTPPPSIDSVRPDVSPPAGGGLALVQGSGFFDVSSVRVGEVEVTDFALLASDRLELVVPPGPPGAARILIIAAGGSTEVSQGILYAAPDVIDDDVAPTAPSGPSVVSCSLVSPHSSVGWLAIFGLLAQRRRRQ